MKDAHDKRAGKAMESSANAKGMNACKIIGIFYEKQCNLWPRKHFG
jgi:hypothetical protein